MDTNLTTSQESQIIRLERVEFRYGQSASPILSEVWFSLHSREVVAVVGRSGIGKSTLLKLLSGELRPSSGVAVRAAELDRAGSIAYVDQESTLFPWMRVRQIVGLALSRAHDNRAGSNLVEEVLRAFGLEGSAEKYPRQLSGGMKQRLALAFALLRRPQILLLDEPFVSLDDFTKDTMYELLQGQVKHTQTALVIITHDINECLKLSDRVVVLAGRGPATVVGNFAVGGQKPRSSSILLEPEFVTLNREIRAAILSKELEFDKSVRSASIMAP